MRITLRQLSVFLAVARDDGVTAAGQRIGLSQAAVSQSLAELESVLGRQLFDRVGRRVVLNSEGRALLSRARDIINRVEALESGAVDLSEPLNLGASVTLGNYSLPQVLMPFMASHRDAEIAVLIRNTQEMLDPLLRAQVDMALVEGTLVHRELVCHPWRRDSLAIVVSPGHRLAGQQVAPVELADETWILREQGSGTREVFERATTPHFPIHKVALDAGGNELLKDAVRHNLGIGCISATAVADDLAAGRLVRLEVPWLNLERTFSVVLHRSRQPEAMVSAFLRHCRQWVEPPFDELPFWRQFNDH